MELLGIFANDVRFVAALVANSMLLTNIAWSGNQDPLTERWFSGDFQVVNSNKSAVSLADAIRQIFPYAVSPQIFGALVGAPNESIVTIEADASASSARVSVDVRHPFFWDHSSVIMKDATDPPRLELWELNRKMNAPPQMGLRSIAYMALHGRLLGFREVVVEFAAGPKVINWTGYRTFPEMGFDAPFTPQEQQQIPAEFAGARSPLELLQRPGGKLWWKIHGWPRSNIRLDLARHSSSRRQLLHQLDHFQIRLGRCFRSVCEAKHQLRALRSY